ncbi:MAG: type II toxin-antitoxin system VapC family toxin [Terracidiphilus sp.]
MNFLLDTHTFIWFLQEPERLPREVHAVVVGSDQPLALSIATPWEMAIKAGAGKLKTPEILDNFELLARKCGCIILPLTVRHVIASGLLPLHHKDPFDRLLIAQALDLNLPILSCDEIFDRYDVKRIWN